MLNLKKGLALVLAAATALTFAPLTGLNAPVAAEARSNSPKVVFLDNSNPAKSINVDSIDVRAGSTSAAQKFRIVNDDANKKVTWTTADSDIATATVTDDNSTITSTGSAAYTGSGSNVVVKGVSEGTTSLTIKLDGTAIKTIPVNVLGSLSTREAKVAASDISIPVGKTGVKIGTIAISGKNYSKTLSQEPTVTDTTASTSTKGTGRLSTVTSSVKVDSRTSATGALTVDTTLAEVGDEFDITFSGDVDSINYTGVNKIHVTVVKKAAQEFTYGNILDHIYAYKNASYDLAEHAYIAYTPQGKDKRNLNPNEIRWWLVDANSNPEEDIERGDLKTISLPTTAGTVSQGQYGSLKVTVNDAHDFATYFSGNPAKVVAEAWIDGVRTIVYVDRYNLDAQEITGNVAVISKSISANVQGQGKHTADDKIGVLGDKIANPTKDNIYLKAGDVDYPTDRDIDDNVQTENKYELTVVKASDNNANPFAGSYLSLKAAETGLPTGDYYETAYIPFQVNGANTTYILKVDVKVSVNTGVQFRVKEGSDVLASTHGDSDLSKDPTVYLNLADKKTFDIFEHIEADVDKTKVSFSYDSDSANVTVDGKGVVTPVSVGNAKITITGSYNGITSQAVLTVRVNQYAFDTVTVKGQDGETARVLDTRDYDNNDQDAIAGEHRKTTSSTGEYQLVTRQIGYVQIEITGSETSNVVESPVVTSANGASLSYSFVDDTKTMSDRGLTIDPSTGKITIDYNACKDRGAAEGTAKALGVYAVKVVSAGTSKSEATTNYYYVVVDYPDQTISGLEDNYTVGACAIKAADHDDVNAVELAKESGSTATAFKTVEKATDDFKGVSYYTNDDVNSFVNCDTRAVTFVGNGIIQKAWTSGKTEHVVAYNAQSGHLGYTAKLITVTSAPAVENKITTIKNQETGDVIYDSTKDSNKQAAHISINDITRLQVTLEHPVASAVSGSAVELNLVYPSDRVGKKVINQREYVTGVVSKNNVDVTLYPNAKGTTVVEIGPGGHLTATDRTDIHQTQVLLAVEYDGKNATAEKPAKITGVKVGNKKGAKVVVKFAKSSLDKNGLSMKYYVQKKVGKKTSGKSIGSARTTLSVKKGATVKVRVKAYYYDANGQKHVGAYSKWVTKKTDKK